MDEKDIMRSKVIKTTTIVVGVLLVAFVSFAGGLAVGFRKARFSYAFGENYERNFMVGMREGARGDDMVLRVRGVPATPSLPSMISRDFDDRGLRNGHGLIGEILSISETSIIVQDASGEENIVSVDDKTLVRGSGEKLNLSDLKVGNRIAVIGKPGDNGAVNADFIRVLVNPSTK